MSYYTGEVIEGTVVIETTREVSSRGLYVDFTGTEETVITRSAGKTTVTYRSKATIVQWRLPVRGEESIQPGTYRYPFQFQIPLHALPSYAGRHASVKYILTARLDVPLWLTPSGRPRSSCSTIARASARTPSPSGSVPAARAPRSTWSWTATGFSRAS